MANYRRLRRDAIASYVSYVSFLFHNSSIRFNSLFPHIAYCSPTQQKKTIFSCRKLARLNPLYYICIRKLSGVT